MNNELIADGQLLGDYDSDVVIALIPFAYWYDLNDCDNSTKGHIEVPIEDLRRAYNAIGDENIAERYHLQNVVMHTELIERPLCPNVLYELSDREIEEIWKNHGGDQHGPIVEQYFIKEDNFYNCIREIIKRANHYSLCPETLESAAKVADEHAEDCWTMGSESLSVSQGRNKASKHIAQKIRNLKGEA